MSNNSYRFGPAVFAGSTLPVETILYLAFRDEHGREEVTHSYDKATATFTAIRDDRVQVESASSSSAVETTPLNVPGWQFGLSGAVDLNLFEFKIDGIVVLSLEDGILKANSFWERPAPAAPSIIFRARRSSKPEALAVVTYLGELYSPVIREDPAVAEDTEAFQLKLGTTRAVINKTGVIAADIEAREDILITDTGDFFEFETGVLWVL